jgi:hypothetical protein
MLKPIVPNSALTATTIQQPTTCHLTPSTESSLSVDCQVFAFARDYVLLCSLNAHPVASNHTILTLSNPLSTQSVSTFFVVYLTVLSVSQTENVEGLGESK